MLYLFISLLAQQHKYHPNGSTTQILPYWLNNTNISLHA